jgi:hypothetical protein
MARDGGLGHVRAGVARPDPACLQHMQRGPQARSSCRRWLRLQRSPRSISTPSAAHFLKPHQLLVQKFAADRNRQKGRVFARRAFPKTSSALSAKVCGGSRSAKRPRLRETGKVCGGSRSAKRPRLRETGHPAAPASEPDLCASIREFSLKTAHARLARLHYHRPPQVRWRSR